MQENANTNNTSGAALIASILAAKSALRAKEANNGNAMRESDRVEDGIIICGVCGKPRQRRLDLPLSPLVWTLCDCELKRRAEEDAKREAEEKGAKISALLSRLAAYRIIDAPSPPEITQNADGSSTIKRKHAHTFADDDRMTPAASNFAKAYADNFENYKKDGTGLVLYGNVGRGKSFLAECIVAELTDRGYAVAMTSFSRIESALWDVNDRQYALDLLTRLDLIALDDMFAERDTTYMTEKVFTIVDTLYKAKVPMIITTNMTTAQLNSNAGRDIGKDRVLSRLREACLFREISGQDRRRVRADKRSQN